MKGFDAVLVQFERLVVNGADEIAAGIGKLVQNGARFRVFLGLSEHESSEFLAGEGARTIEQGAVEIFVEGDETGVERGERKIVAVLKFFPIQVESCRGLFSRGAIPSVGKNDATDVPEECCNLRQGCATSGLWTYVG